MFPRHVGMATTWPKKPCQELGLYNLSGKDDPFCRSSNQEPRFSVLLNSLPPPGGSVHMTKASQKTWQTVKTMWSTAFFLTSGEEEDKK